MGHGNLIIMIQTIHSITTHTPWFITLRKGLYARYQKPEHFPSRDYETFLSVTGDGFRRYCENTLI